MTAQNSIFDNIVSQFPIFKTQVHGFPLIYLDTAATAQKPQMVIDAMSHFYACEYATVHRALYTLSSKATEKYYQARVDIQKFFNAQQPEEIIFTSGTTESINLVAQSFCQKFMQKDDEIVLTEIEHHSNIVPWQMAAQRQGLVLKFCSVDDQGNLDLAHFKSLLSHRTKLISCAHVSNILGTIHPIEEICFLAHQKGAKVLIDGAQSAACIPIDLQTLDIDFFACSSHKMYGPTGLGILYGKKEWLEEMDPLFGGGDMIEQVSLNKTTYTTIPTKFEAGTPKIAEVIGLKAAIQFLNEIDKNNIHAHLTRLTEYTLQKMHSIPQLQFLGKPTHRAGIISFLIPPLHPMDIASLLDLKGVAIRTGHLCTQPAMQRFHTPFAARVSLGVYNTHQDIDLFIDHLQSVIAML